MEESKNACITVNLSEGNISISGSEQFVEKNMERVLNFLEKNLHDNSITSNIVTTATTPVNPDTSAAQTSEEAHVREKPTASEDQYIKAGVYHIDSEDGSISILKNIPGGNKAEKTKNIALIVLHIKGGKVPGKDIVPICEKHACYDPSNFSKTFNNEKTNIIRKGSGQTWTIELTQPGESAAIALLDEMANGKK